MNRVPAMDLVFPDFGLYGNGNTVETKHTPRFQVGCGTSVFREAQTWLDGSWHSFSSLNLL